jgi:hypothetical protein
MSAGVIAVVIAVFAGLLWVLIKRTGVAHGQLQQLDMYLADLRQTIKEMASVISLIDTQTNQIAKRVTVIEELVGEIDQRTELQDERDAREWRGLTPLTIRDVRRWRRGDVVRLMCSEHIAGFNGGRAVRTRFDFLFESVSDEPRSPFGYSVQGQIRESDAAEQWVPDYSFTVDERVAATTSGEGEFRVRT